MSKKDVILLPIYFVTFLVVLYLCAVVFSLFGEHELNSESSGFQWVKEESYLLDYQITEDTIQFRYSMCFENYSEYTYIISSMTAQFSKAELSGWLEYNKFFSGDLEGEDYEVLIESGKKQNVIYIFTGKYLGGTVNKLLSPPERISYISRIAWNSGSTSSSTEGQGDGLRDGGRFA